MRRSRTGILVLGIVATLLLTAQAWAQNPTGTLTGRVIDSDGGALPGVLVSVESPALQGTRTTYTGVNGDYKIPFLPPGIYQVQVFELEDGHVDQVARHPRKFLPASSRAGCRVRRGFRTVVETRGSPQMATV